MLCAICLVYTLGLSAAAHKEFRFLHPLLPLTSLLTALGLAHVQAWIDTRASRKTGAQAYSCTQPRVHKSIELVVTLSSRLDDFTPPLNLPSRLL